AANVLQDIKDRLKHLETAPQPENAPTVFFYDLTGKEIMSAGSLSPAQAVIDAAGGTNVLEDIDADFTKVSWERLTADKPDYFLVSDYGEGEQSYSNKITELKSNPATRDLAAVKKDRFIKLPIQMLLGTPEMIDAAEHLRKALEDADLVPQAALSQSSSSTSEARIVQLRPNDSGRRLRRKMVPMAAGLIAATIGLAGCGGDGDQAEAASQ